VKQPGRDARGKPSPEHRPGHVAAADDEDRSEAHASPAASTSAGVERVARLLVAPQHELERRVEPVAFGDRALDRELRHLQAEHALAAEHQPVAVKQHPAVRPDVEVAEPELLVDQREQLPGGLALGFGYADLGQAQQLQHLVLGAPDAADLVGRPASLDLAARSRRR
jgi:hypothetical protein